MPKDKIGTIEFCYFTKGQYVDTPYGVGMVYDDEPEIRCEYDLSNSEVLILIKSEETTFKNIKRVNRFRLTRIGKDQYTAGSKYSF